MLIQKRSVRLWMISLLAIICSGAVDSRENDYPTLRQAMVQVIRESVLRTADYIDRKALAPRVMEAMSTVPRHEFVPEAVKSSAYEDRPLPIGKGQTISQPYIVALMTDLMHPGPEQKVLEVGTGSGYQAAVLAELIDKVYTIEIIEELGEQAADRFQRLDYGNITARVGDGYYGWEEHAPFDAILVTAASSHIPPPLIKQLKPGGRMVIPVGGPFMVQQLVLIEKTEQGKIITHQILPVRFVPLTGDH